VLEAPGILTFVGNFRPSVDPLPDPEEPIRTELFSVERLEQHAESLAAAQRVTDDPRRGWRLLPRLVDNGRALLASYRALAEAIREERAITAAAEWLVDNFHIVDDQLRQIREDLPRRFYRELPKLAAGFLEGYPRVFGVGWAFVAHTDSRFEPEALRRFVRAYQRVQPLTIGELWAVPITLRILLVENLRRLAERIVRDRAARQEADELADPLLGLGGRTPADATAVLARVEQQRLPTAFAVQLVQRLREQDPDVVPALGWLEERFAAQGTTSEEIVRLEHHRQGAMNVTVRNIITSMRLMSNFDWKEFFESISRVDEVLRADTDFAALDFPTRDRYRHAIEDLARGSRCSEVEVACRVVARTKEAAATNDAGHERRRDPGYHLLSQGRAALEHVGAALASVAAGALAVPVDNPTAPTSDGSQAAFEFALPVEDSQVDESPVQSMAAAAFRATPSPVSVGALEAAPAEAASIFGDTFASKLGISLAACIITLIVGSIALLAVLAVTRP